MTPRIEGWSVVLAGYWNPMIFTPTWIKNKLTNADIAIEVPINNLFLPVKFSFDDISLLVRGDMLTLTPLKVEDDILKRIQNISIQILEELYQTPLTGLGINFGFIKENPNVETLKIFEINDNAALIAAGFKIKGTLVKRSFKINDHLLNLNIRSDDINSIIYDFNFHKDIKEVRMPAIF